MSPVSGLKPASAAVVFSHTPVAPYVPKKCGHTVSRYYTRSGSSEGFHLRLSENKEPFCPSAEVSVMRLAADRHAQLNFHLTNLKLKPSPACNFQLLQQYGFSDGIITGYLSFVVNTAAVCLHANASELRHIACLLLDAAHDLEVNSPEISRAAA